MIRAEEKDTVKVRYIGRLENGTIFDQSPEEAPLQFILGCQEVISGFDEAVLGMFQGESKKVVIPCEKAYGLSKPELIEKVAKDLLEGKVKSKDTNLYKSSLLCNLVWSLLAYFEVQEEGPVNRLVYEVRVSLRCE